jgi:lysophospholipase L1-like esterase
MAPGRPVRRPATFVAAAVTTLCLVIAAGWSVTLARPAGADPVQPAGADPVQSAGATPVSPQYLALGGSASVGVQPTAQDPRGRPTDAGYADDVVVAARSRWPGLQLTELGCPGESTGTMVSGEDRCHHGHGSQLSGALEFLHTHPSTVLVTVDLGFNDVRSCLRGRSVRADCAARGIDSVRRQLPAILSDLRAAAGPRVVIVGVGHYDPFVAGIDAGSVDRDFAVASLSVIDHLDAVLRSVYATFGVPMADVLSSFDQSAPLHDSSTGGSSVEDRTAQVENERVCELTWMCRPPPYGPNLHPDDEGYRVIARAILSVLPPTG